MTAPSSPFLPSLQSTTTVYLPHATTAIDLLPPYHGYVFQEKNIEDGILRCHDLFLEEKTHPLYEETEMNTIEPFGKQANNEEEVFIHEESKTETKCFESLHETTKRKDLGIDVAKKEERKNEEKNVSIDVHGSDTSPLPGCGVSVAEESHTPISGGSNTISLRKQEEEMGVFSPPSSTALPPTSSRHSTSLGKMAKTPFIPHFRSVGGTNRNDPVESNDLPPCATTPKCGVPVPHSSSLEIGATTPSVCLHARDACDAMKGGHHTIPAPMVHFPTAPTLMTDSRLDADPLPHPPLPCPSSAIPAVVPSPPPTGDSTWHSPSRVPRSAWRLGSVASFRPRPQTRDAALAFHRRQRRYPEKETGAPLPDTPSSPLEDHHRPAWLPHHREDAESRVGALDATVAREEEETEWKAALHVPPVLAPVCQNGSPPTTTIMSIPFLRTRPSHGEERTAVDGNGAAMGNRFGSTPASSLSSAAPPLPLASGKDSRDGLVLEHERPPLGDPPSFSSACAVSGAHPAVNALSSTEKGRRGITEALDKLQSSEWFVQQYHARQQEESGTEKAARRADERPLGGTPSSSPACGVPSDAWDGGPPRKPKDEALAILAKQTAASLAPWFAVAGMTSTVPLPPPPPAPSVVTLSLPPRTAQRLHSNLRGTPIATHQEGQSGRPYRLPESPARREDDVQVSVEGENPVERVEEDAHRIWQQQLEETLAHYVVDEVGENSSRPAVCMDLHHRREEEGMKDTEERKALDSHLEGSEILSSEKKRDSERDEKRRAAPSDANAEAVRALFHSRQRDGMPPHDIACPSVKEEEEEEERTWVHAEISRRDAAKPAVEAAAKSSILPAASIALGDTKGTHLPLHSSLPAIPAVFSDDGIPVPRCFSPSATTMVEDVVRGLPRASLFASVEPPNAATYFQLLLQALFPSLGDEERVMRWRAARHHLPWLEGSPTAVLPTNAFPFPALLPSPPVCEKRRHPDGSETKKAAPLPTGAAFLDTAVGSGVATSTRRPRVDDASRSSSSSSGASSATPHPSSSDPRGPGLPLWQMASRNLQAGRATPPTTISCEAHHGPAIIKEKKKDVVLPQLRWVWYEEIYHRHLLVREEEVVNPIPYYGSFGAAPGGHAALEERLQRPMQLYSIDTLHAELDQSVQKVIADILHVPLPKTVTSLDGALTVCMAAAPLPEPDGKDVPASEGEEVLEEDPSSSSLEKETLPHPTIGIGDSLSAPLSPFSSLLPEGTTIAEGTTKEGKNALSKPRRRKYGAAEKSIVDKHVQQALHEKYAIWKEYSFFHRDLKARLDLVQEEKKARLEVLGSFISCRYPQPCRCLLWDMEILEESAIELSPAIPRRCVFVSVVLSFGHRRIQEDLLSKRQVILDRWQARLNLMLRTFSTRAYFEMDEQRQREKWSLYHEYCMHVASQRELLLAHKEPCVQRNLSRFSNGHTDCEGCRTGEEKTGNEDEKTATEEDQNENEEEPNRRTEHHTEHLLGASKEIVVERRRRASSTGSGSADSTLPAEVMEKHPSNGHSGSSPASLEIDSHAGKEPSLDDSSESSSSWASSSTSAIDFHEGEKKRSDGAALRCAYENPRRILPTSTPQSRYTSLLRHCRLHTIGVNDSPFCSYVKFMEIVITIVLEEEERGSFMANESLAACKIEEAYRMSFLFASHITAEKKEREALVMEECQRREVWARQIWMEEWSILSQECVQKELKARQTLLKNLIHRMTSEGEEEVRQMSAQLFHQYMKEWRVLKVEWWSWRRQCMSQKDLTTLVATWGVEGPREQCIVEETRRRLQWLSREEEQWKKALEIFTVVQQEYYVPRDRMVRGDEVKERCLLAIEEEESRARANILNMNQKHYHFLLAPSMAPHERKANSESFSLERRGLLSQSSWEQQSHLSATAGTITVLPREDVPGKCSPLNTLVKEGDRLTESISSDAERESQSSRAALTGGLLRHIIADVNAFVPVEELVEFFSS